jgi:hypothetical protein
MVGGMKENIKMIKSMVMVFTLGQIRGDMKVTGLGVNSMVWVFIQFQIVILKTGYGKTASV